MVKIALYVMLGLALAACAHDGYQPPGPDLWRMPS